MPNTRMLLWIALAAILYLNYEAWMHDYPALRERDALGQSAAGAPWVALISNPGWDQPVSETPALGTTEIWEITDTTPDTHPIHVHLVQFNLLDRQEFDKPAYLAAYNQLNGGGYLPGPNPSCPVMTNPVSPPGMANAPQLVPDATPYLRGPRILPAANEAGWKDSVRVKEHTVSRFLIRFRT